METVVWRQWCGDRGVETVVWRQWCGDSGVETVVWPILRTAMALPPMSFFSMSLAAKETKDGRRANRLRNRMRSDTVVARVRRRSSVAADMRNEPRRGVPFWPPEDVDGRCRTTSCTLGLLARRCSALRSWRASCSTDLGVGCGEEPSTGCCEALPPPDAAVGDMCDAGWDWALAAPVGAPPLEDAATSPDVPLRGVVSLLLGWAREGDVAVALDCPSFERGGGARGTMDGPAVARGMTEAKNRRMGR